MTKEHILDIALKLFGIYWALETVKFFFAFGSLFIASSDKFWEFYTSKVGFLVSQVPLSLLYLFLSYIFLFRTQWLIKLVGGKEYDASLPQVSQISEWQTYSFWIKILGLYYFVSSAASIAAHALDLVIKDSGSFHVFSSGGSLLTNVITLLLAFLFIFKTNMVEDLITKRKIKGTDMKINPTGNSPL